MKLFSFGKDLEERDRSNPNARAPRPPKLGLEVGAESVDGDFTSGIGAGLGVALGFLGAGYVASKLVRR